jgi:hypothetical protein
VAGILRPCTGGSSMKANRLRTAAGEKAEQSPGLRLNRRMKEILATGLLPSLSPSALTVLTYAAAYGDFSTCKVFMGSKTVAGKAFTDKRNRSSAKNGIAELLDVGFLVEVKGHTHRQATVYRIGLVHDRIEAARQRMAAVGMKRRKTDEQKAAEAAAKKRKAKESAVGEGAHGSAPGGLIGESPGGSPVSPQGAHGSAPNHSSIVPSSLKERYSSGRLSRRSRGHEEGERERQVRAAAIKRRATA